jgi:ABC-2 type transport system ATP-binding protein
MSAPLQATALGKHFRRGWALRDCTLTIPEGAIVGLAGPNGAGKSTLLGLAVGLLDPTEGEIAVLGCDPRHDPKVLPSIGYVPQDAPLYRSFTVAETLEFARITNERWDGVLARELIERIRSGARVGTLTAGERSRLALAIALGKRPRLLLLDEPFARLDPLASRAFLQTLMDGVSETESTVVIASHVIADIERVCDHIVLLSHGAVRLEGNVDELLGSHRLLTGARRPLGAIHGVQEVVRERHSGRQLTLLVRTRGPVLDPTWAVDEIRLGELLLSYMAPEQVPDVRPPAPEPGRLRWHG